jgi:hypothetical protein
MFDQAYADSVTLSDAVEGVFRIARQVRARGGEDENARKGPGVHA